MNVLTITTPDIENGYGCRVTLWVAGCKHNCPGCHNQHTWDYNQGTSITSEKVFNKVYDELNHEYIKGLTISGGDPLCQTPESLNELKEFIYKIKKSLPDKDIWIYTGYYFEDIKNNPLILDVLDLCDVLVDGPFKQEEYSDKIAFRGSCNQHVIDLKDTFKENHTVYLFVDKEGF